MKRKILNCLIIATVMVMFVSCGAEADKKPDPITIEGTVVGEYTMWDNVHASFDDGDTWVATSPISNGKFSIELSKPDKEYLIPMEYLLLQFPDGISMSDKNAQGVGATFFTRKALLVEEITLINTSTSPITQIFYIYADRNVNFSGNIEDDSYGEGSNITYIVDCKLKKGWNTMLVTQGQTEIGLIYTFKTGAVLSGSVWLTDDQIWRL